MEHTVNHDPGRAGVVLVTGATGYVGGRLVPELLAAGYRVRVLARHPERVVDRAWAGQVEVAAGDVTDRDGLADAMHGVSVAYYLIHSMSSGADFSERDRLAARTFAETAADAGVTRIVYLGGLHPEGKLSPHLRSRVEVAEILLASPVPAVVLNAAVIIGSGSASFEMLRHLTERLPVMVGPKWLDNRLQPIAIRDVLHHLVGAASVTPEINRAFDIGGPDVVAYRDMIQRYARTAGLVPRRFLVLPVLTPRLASLWVGLITPVPASIARPLVQSLLHEVVVRECDVEAVIPPPDGGCIGLDRALDLALQRVRDFDISTTWSSASYRNAPSDPMPEDPDWAGGDLYVDERATRVDAAPEDLWAVIEGIGGRTGWYSWPLAWWARGAVDRLLGGPGLRRGRRDPVRLMTGDAVDWWRVERLERGRLLRLRAEMRLPGMAWLELSCESDADGSTVFRQRAIHHPSGLLGRIYWWAMVPFHGITFGGMQRNIAERARARANRPDGAEPGPPPTA